VSGEDASAGTGTVPAPPPDPEGALLLVIITWLFVARLMSVRLRSVRDRLRRLLAEGLSSSLLSSDPALAHLSILGSALYMEINVNKNPEQNFID